MTRTSPRSSLVCALCGALALLVGGLSLLGWAADVPVLTDFLRGGLAMQPNTSLAVALLGVSALLLAGGWRRTAAVPALAAGLIGVLTLIENVAGVDLGIDRLLLFDRPWGSRGTMAPGRMGLPASVCLAVLGAGYSLAAAGPRGRSAASRLAVVSATVAGLPLLGFLLGVQQLYAVSRMTAISPQTVAALLALSAGLSAAVPERGLGRILSAPGPGGGLARRLLPISLLAPLAVTLFALETIRRGADPGLALALAVLLMVVILAVTGLGMARRVEEDAARLSAALADRQRALDRLSLLLENTPLAAIEWDTDLRVVRWSSGAERLFGLRAEQVVGSAIGELGLVHEDDEQVVADVSARLLGGRERYVVSRNRNRTADGRVLHCEWYNSIVPGPAGRTEAVLSLVLDVTARREAEAALLRTNEDMRRFAYLASHDMREPLRTIITYSALLDRRAGPRLDADDRESLQFMAEAARRLNEMILGFLDLSRVSQRELAPADLDLERVTAEVARSLQVAIADASAEVTVVPGARVRADEILLRQALQNLIENALKFRGEACRIEVGARREDGGTTVWVRDNGIGIPDADQPRVLEVFRRGHDRRFPGAGLGLSTTAKVAERHGGRIWLRSREGEGTTVFMSFPGAPSPQPAALPTRDS